MKRIHLNKSMSKFFILFILTLSLTFSACAQGVAPAPGAKVIEKPKAPAIITEASWEQQSGATSLRKLKGKAGFPSDPLAVGGASI